MSDTLKFGFPDMCVSDISWVKKPEVLVTFLPKPSGSVSDVSEVQPKKQLDRVVTFCPNPAGNSKDVIERHPAKHPARVVAA